MTEITLRMIVREQIATAIDDWHKMVAECVIDHNDDCVIYTQDLSALSGHKAGVELALLSAEAFRAILLDGSEVWVKLSGPYSQGDAENTYWKIQSWRV